MHGVDQGRHVVGGHAGKDAVAEVEDVAGPARGLVQNPLRLPPDLVRRGEQDDGVEVAHDGHAVAQPVA